MNLLVVPLGCCFGIGSVVAGQQWTAIPLHPPGTVNSDVFAVTASRQGGYLQPPYPAQAQAGFWQTSSGSWTPLSVSTQFSSEVHGMDAAIQVGYAPIACLWYGSPETRVDLAPPGAGASSCQAVSGNMQVGGAFFGGVSHAAMWRGTAASFVDLGPPSSLSSEALATDGVLQGGASTWQVGAFSEPHATIWRGTSESYQDLNPSGSSESSVRGMAPGVQVGYAFISHQYRAAVWRGTAQSFTDLNGNGYAARLYATTGRVHVGSGGQSGPTHALVNFGSPDSWLDLHQFLPSGYSTFSGAAAVFQDGQRIYVGGYAVSDATGEHNAFLWIGTDACYANCDQSTQTPTLNVNDFICFIAAFSSGAPYANCDASTVPPTLNVNDFICFLSRFAAGCT